MILTLLGYLSNPSAVPLQVLVTPLGIFHPERKLESVYLCIYNALIYFPKVIPRFCRGTHVFMVSYRKLFHMGVVQ